MVARCSCGANVEASRSLLTTPAADLNAHEAWRMGPAYRTDLGRGP